MIGRDAAVQMDAERVDPPAEHPSAALAELLRHRVRRHLDDVDVEAECPECVRRFQAEQTAADDEPGRARRVVAHSLIAARSSRRAVDERPGEVVSGNRRHERCRTGGEDQIVVGELATVVERGVARVGVDPVTTRRPKR